MRSVRKALVGALFLSSSLVLSGHALAQSDSAGEATAEELVITGEITYRNRTETTAPELVYDQQFFEQFEPTSVGDQLKRVPGVAFTSDIGEYDAPQLRGLGDGFTQVLVNGRPIPGAGNDRTVFVDRIPAEIIDRIEIVRSPSADIDSQGVGGTINIILKDGASLPPGVIARVGVNYDIDREHASPLAALSLSGRNDAETLFYSLTVDYQKRFNRKDGVQETFEEDSVGFADSADGLDLFQPDNRDLSQAVERQEQLDFRRSTDITLNGDLTFRPNDRLSLRLDGFYISTRRKEGEEAVNFEGDGSIGGVDYSDAEYEAQRADIDQDSWGLAALLEYKITENLTFESQLRFNQFEDYLLQQDFVEGDTDDVIDFGTVDDELFNDAADREWTLDGALKANLPQLAEQLGVTSMNLNVGAFGKIKKRHYEGAIASINDETVIFDYTERRLDVFAVGEVQITPALKFQVGVRAENTTTDQDLDDGTSVGSDEFELNPSAHLQWNLTGNDQFRLSVARTVRRPNLEQVLPVNVIDSPEDDDLTRGNPNLVFETAWGIDVGYERRFAGRGVFGVNYFYRSVDNLISLVTVPDETAPGGGGVYTFENTGKGKVWGVEFDLSAPLSFIGLEETGVFANYTRLWSERIEPTTGIETTFDRQPDYVYNVGVTQNLPDWGVSFGASYQKQGTSHRFLFGEIEDQRYGANLEVFVEKRFGDKLVFRLSGNNLLDADSIQNERNFDGDTGAEIIENQRNNIVDNFEIERENSSPTVTFTIRAIF